GRSIRTVSAAEQCIAPDTPLTPVRSSAVTHKFTVAGLATTLLAWTAYWVMQALPMLEVHTRNGSGTWRPGLDGHDIFEFIFDACHCLVRWAPGAVLVIGLFVLLQWRRQRAVRKAAAAI